MSKEVFGVLNLVLALIFSNPVKLNIIVKNIQAGAGNIVVEIYDNENNFLKKSTATKTVEAGKETLDLFFDIPEGTYAIAVYQDLNENKLLDLGWLKIPKEPYGLSNNYRPKFSAPTFENCKFELTQEKTLTILLK